MDAGTVASQRLTIENSTDGENVHLLPTGRIHSSFISIIADWRAAA